MPSYIFLFLFPILLSKIIKIGHPMSKSKVKATSDDYLLDFSVNGISVDIEAFKDLCTWQTLKTFELYLKPGDVLSFESISKSYQRIKGEDVITCPKTKKSNRVIQMPQFLSDEIQDYIKQLTGHVLANSTS